jgi:hypothetical protein
LNDKRYLLCYLIAEQIIILLHLTIIHNEEKALAAYLRSLGE